MALAKLELKLLSVLEKLDLANGIVQAMSGNPNFPSPMPALPEVQAGIDALRQAHQAAEAARQTARVRFQQQEDAEDALDRLLSALAADVQFASAGEETKILSAGIPLRRPRSTAHLVMPENLCAAFGRMPGEIDLWWENQRGARCWLVECCERIDGAQGPWQGAKTATRASTTVGELVSGRVYVFRVRALGTRESLGPWSDIVVQMAP